MEQETYDKQREKIIDLLTEWNRDIPEHTIFGDYTLIALFAEYLLRNQVRANTENRTYIPYQELLYELDKWDKYESDSEEERIYEIGFRDGLTYVDGCVTDIIEDEYEL